MAHHSPQLSVPLLLLFILTLYPPTHVLCDTPKAAPVPQMAAAAIVARGEIRANFAPTIENRYLPSSLEKEWTKNVDGWSKSDGYCTHIVAYTDSIRLWTETTAELMATQDIATRMRKGGGTFSRFQRKVTCKGLGGQEHRLVSWIEPLAFALRYPAALCRPGSTSDIDNRSHLLLMSALELQRMSCGRRKVRTFLFDLGSGTWSQTSNAKGADGWSSQRWLTEAYARRGIRFDRMLMWDDTPRTNVEIYTDVPPDMLHGYQFMNIAVSSHKDDPANPLNVLKRITHPLDFVVLKIDITNHDAEVDLLRQLVSDPEIQSRVDEVFIEHHVRFPRMLRVRWSEEFTSADETLVDSYNLLKTLRDKGIRAHGWP